MKYPCTFKTYASKHPQKFKSHCYKILIPLTTIYYGFTKRSFLLKWSPARKY
uniref:Uncharacterized protein n=1 Tax=Rhizophora mucronata TaxID=61149 RepID=A0A2P2PCK8_RHIMU